MLAAHGIRAPSRLRLSLLAAASSLALVATEAWAQPAGGPPSVAPAPQAAPIPTTAQPYPYPYPYPYGSPPGYPPQPSPYLTPYVGPAPQRAAAIPEPAPPEAVVSWYLRLHLGVGPMAFSGETSILRLEGYNGAKLWAMVDGAYMLDHHVGAGAFVVASHLSIAPPNAPSLAETDLLVGAGIPIKLGSRSLSCVLTPRAGYAAGRLDLGGSAGFQSAFAWGGDLSLTTFRYHLSAMVGYLRAAGDPGGAAGRTHDFGGLYASLGGTIDG
jgi:hypothetical protein